MQYALRHSTLPRVLPRKTETSAKTGQSGGTAGARASEPDFERGGLAAGGGWPLVGTGTDRRDHERSVEDEERNDRGDGDGVE